MILPSPPALLFLIYLLLFLPYAALRSAQRLRERASTPARRTIWTSTLLSLAVLFAMSWFTARTFDYADDLFAVPPLALRDYALAAAALAAAVAEEVAYRGVGVQILWYSLGSQTAAILICATAFAIAHALQGWKSAVMIFALALVLHALVELTGTLVLAMVVHAVYDLVAGWIIARDARRLPGAA